MDPLNAIILGIAVLAFIATGVIFFTSEAWRDWRRMLKKHPGPDWKSVDLNRYANPIAPAYKGVGSEPRTFPYDPDVLGDRERAEGAAISFAASLETGTSKWDDPPPTPFVGGGGDSGGAGASESSPAPSIDVPSSSAESPSFDSVSGGGSSSTDSDS